MAGHVDKGSLRMPFASEGQMINQIGAGEEKGTVSARSLLSNNHFAITRHYRSFFFFFFLVYLVKEGATHTIGVEFGSRIVAIGKNQVKLQIVSRTDHHPTHLVG
jgi:hypothetical protein